MHRGTSHKTYYNTKASAKNLDYRKLDTFENSITKNKAFMLAFRREPCSVDFW